MARIFLYIIAGIIGLMLVVLILLNIFQDEALELAFIPPDPYEKYEVPPLPSYSDADSWAIFAEGDGEADIFYIHPTTFLRPTGWNASLDNPEALRVLETGPLKYQASIFAPVGRLYAPRYRQAVFGTFLKDSVDAEKALELAYRDVVRAFAHYMEEENQNRPFVIAAHSQGAKHAFRMLKERIFDTPVADRLVAAYLVGWPINAHEDAPVCTAAGQTGCILSWSTFAEGGDPVSYLENIPGGKIICTNPLSWQTGTERAVAALNLGSVGKRPGIAPLPDPAPGLTGARCGEDGILYITPPQHPDFQTDIWPGLNYHLYDYRLFYENVRQNAMRRIKIFNQ